MRDTYAQSASGLLVDVKFAQSLIAVEYFKIINIGFYIWGEEIT